VTPPKFNSHLEWSHVCIRWVLWRFRQRSVYGCGPLQASLGRLLTSKGCKGMIEYIKTTYVQPITTQGEPVTAVGYGFTDLRIYPPPSSSSPAPRSSGPARIKRTIGRCTSRVFSIRSRRFPSIRTYSRTIRTLFACGNPIRGSMTSCNGRNGRYSHTIRTPSQNFTPVHACEYARSTSSDSHVK
jgi:hypothetical protein